MRSQINISIKSLLNKKKFLILLEIKSENIDCTTACLFNFQLLMHIASPLMHVQNISQLPPSVLFYFSFILNRVHRKRKPAPPLFMTCVLQFIKILLRQKHGLVYVYIFTNPCFYLNTIYI